MYGLGAPMAALCDWAKARGVFVIEDAALALGGEVGGKAAGSWGDASILSFGHGKIVDAGIGGALLADDARFAAEAGRVLGELDVWDEQHASLTDQWNQIYWALHQFEDENPRLAVLYPALFDLYGGLVKYSLPGGEAGDYAGEIARGVGELAANVAHGRRMALIYDAILESCPAWTLPRGEGEVLWRYPLLVSRSHRENLLRHLWEQGFTDITRWYPSLRPMFATLCPHLAVSSTPNADRFGAEIINLRVDMGVDEAMASRVVGAVRGYFEG
jgi:dTDP-4-amino-4,6-dideoxygalactose transaminase